MARLAADWPSSRMVEDLEWPSRFVRRGFASVNRSLAERLAGCSRSQPSGWTANRQRVLPSPVQNKNRPVPAGISANNSPSPNAVMLSSSSNGECLHVRSSCFLSARSCFVSVMTFIALVANESSRIWSIWREKAEESRITFCLKWVQFGPVFAGWGLLRLPS